MCLLLKNQRLNCLLSFVAALANKEPLWVVYVHLAVKLLTNYFTHFQRPDILGHNVRACIYCTTHNLILYMLFKLSNNFLFVFFLFCFICIIYTCMYMRVRKGSSVSECVCVCVCVILQNMTYMYLRTCNKTHTLIYI